MMQRTRKRRAVVPGVKKRPRVDLNEEIDSGSEDNDISMSPPAAPQDSEDDLSDSEVATAAARRIRDAKARVRALREEELSRHADEDTVKDAVSRRLQDEALEAAGRLQRALADVLLVPETGSPDVVVFRGHKLSVTCVCVSQDGNLLFSAGKDCAIIKWCLRNRCRLHTVPGGKKGSSHPFHTTHVLSMTLSSDGRYLASGDQLGRVLVFSTELMDKIHTFTGHRGPVAALAFRRGTRQLFSGGHDRTVRHWSLDTGGFVEALFGHTHHVTGLDSLSRERCVSTGGIDRSVRVWKIPEETQLVLNSTTNHGSVECVSMFSEQLLATGSSENSVALWSVQKKHPLHVVRPAHSVSDSNCNCPPDHESWVSSVAALKNSDLLASGSRDGVVRLWKLESSGNRLTQIHQLHLPQSSGFVNALSWSADGKVLAAAVGQEQKLGRWWCEKSAKNCVAVFFMKFKQS